MSDEDTAVEQDEGVAEDAEELSEDEQLMAKLKEAISVEREEIGPLREKLTVTVPPEMLDERRNDQFAELKRDALVPGFRKGHAPLRLVEKRFASDVGERLKGQLLGSGYLAAVEKEGLNTLGDPLFWVKVKEERIDDNGVARKVETEKLLPLDRALDSFSLPQSGPLVFSCEIELKPEFDLPELAKIPVQRPDVSIDTDDVDEELTRMRALRGTFQPVEEGAVEVDDLLYADMKMSVDGESIVSEESYGVAARDVRVEGVPLEGFQDAVVGKKPEEAFTFEAEVPADHENIGIRGKKARFDFTIREIKRRILPPLAEVVSGLGFESEDELRLSLRSSLEARLDSTITEAMRAQIGDYLLEQTKLDLPEALSERQTERTLARRMIEMYRAGFPEAEVEKKLDELRATARDQVVRDLKLHFILEKIAEAREVDVSEEQMNGAIAQMAERANKRFDRVRDELAKGDGLRMLYLTLREGLVLDGLLTDAEISETDGPKKAKRTTAKGKKKSVPKKKTSTRAAKKKVSKPSA